MEQCRHPGCECAYPTPKGEVPVRNTPTVGGNYTTPQASSQSSVPNHLPYTPLDQHALAPTKIQPIKVHGGWYSHKKHYWWLSRDLNNFLLLVFLGSTALSDDFMGCLTVVHFLSHWLLKLPLSGCFSVSSMHSLS